MLVTWVFSSVNLSFAKMAFTSSGCAGSMSAILIAFNSEMNSSSSNYRGESEPNALVIYYYLKNKVAGDVKVTVYKGNIEISELKGNSSPGIHKVIWNMTKRRKRTKQEVERMRQMMERYRSYGFRFPGDINYAEEPVHEGEYTFILTVGDKKFVKTASILQDLWFDK